MITTRSSSLLLLPLLLSLGLLLGACGDSGGDATNGGTSPGDEPGDETSAEDDGETPDEDTSSGPTTGDAVDDDAGPTGEGACPAGEVELTFAIDDTANGTYGTGELIWTGSFSYAAATNSLTFASSWLPDEGPYPLLWDDGPIADGGHEPADAVAGDNIWSVSVCYLAEQDRILSYGALNSDLRWIWSGPNGQIEVPAGATGRIDVEGMAIPAFGDRDFKLFLDLSALHESFSTIGLDTHAVYVKGTMNSWTPVQLLDDGQLGDVAAGDGIVTYHHSETLGPHDGLLQPGQSAQFVFVFPKGDADADEGLEYKVDGNAAPEGVTAEGECVDGWQVLEVVQELDSKGVELNTAIVICDDAPVDPPDEDECSDTVPCEDGWICEDGTCVEEDTGPECDAENPCPEPAICIDGACEIPTVECDDETPCEGADEVCDNGKCVVPGGKPELVLIVPDSGSSFGGTEVTLTGQGFVEGMTVTFDGLDAPIGTLSPSTATVTTPAHAVGSVDVVVTVPGGEQAVFPGGYTYVETAAAPSITDISPDQGGTGGGTTVTITGSNFVAPVTVLFGTSAAPTAEVLPGGTTITTVTPAAPVGPVTVTVNNGDGQQVSVDDGFAFVPDLPDWGRLNGPLTLDTVAGKPTAALEGEVYEPGVTDSAGAAFGLVAEVGYGPQGSDPTTDEGWSWTEASWTQDVGNNDVWAGSLTPPEGTWSATLRFSVSGGQSWLYVDAGGADDGFDPGDVATVTVDAAGAVVLVSSDPATVWPGGGETVVVSGVGLVEGCTFELGGAPLGEATVDEDAQTVTFVAPRKAAGTVTLSATCPDGGDTLALTWGITPDGMLSEWPEWTERATNDVATDWGDDNVLSALYADSDGANLYVAVAGRAFGGDFGTNAIVVFVDTDFGDSTGLTDAAAITDDDGSVDDALGGALAFSAAGFGAEVALGTLDMASYDASSDDPAAAGAGWRDLSDPADLGWLTGASVFASEEAFEAVLPLSELVDPDAPPSLDFGPTVYGFVVRITNADGGYTSNQALPPGVSGASNTTATDAASFEVP